MNIVDHNLEYGRLSTPYHDRADLEQRLLERFRQKLYGRRLTNRKIRDKLEQVDKHIRTHKKSTYAQLLDQYNPYYDRLADWPLINFHRVLELRTEFYDNQIKSDITSQLHDNTVFVTFDGVKGTGKSKTATKLGEYFLSLDYSILTNKAGTCIIEMPMKTSGFIGEGISSNIAYHFQKVDQGERLEEPSLELELYTTQFKLALTRLGHELPALAGVDRSYIGTLAKSTGVVSAKEKEIIHHKMEWNLQKMIELYNLGRLRERCLSEKKKKKPTIRLSRQDRESIKMSDGILIYLGPIPWAESSERFVEAFLNLNSWGRKNPFETDLRHTILSYLLTQIKGKYVVPDLSVIMLCDQEIAQQRQEDRQKKEGRVPKKIDPAELSWFQYFRDQNVIPNALYIDSEKENLEDQFQRVVYAIKERFEDKGTRPTLVEKITAESISAFLKENLIDGKWKER